MLEIHSTIAGHSKIDFKKSVVRRGLRGIGKSLQEDARKLLDNKGVVSKPWEMPGKHTGALQKSIRARVSRSGFLVSVGARRTARHGGKNNNFYAAFLYYGTTSGLSARGDYIGDSFDRRRGKTESNLKDILRDALVVRKVIK